MAVEEEGLFEVLLDGAEDSFAEFGSGAAGLTAEAVVGLAGAEEAADLVDEWALASEVDGALSVAFAVGEAVVGPEASAAVGAPGGDDGALAGDA